MKSRLFVALVLLMASVVSHADIVQMPTDHSSTGVGYLKVDSYQLQNNGADVLLLVRFKPDNLAPTTACAATDNSRIMHYSEAPGGSYLPMLHASIVAAMAQDQGVRVGYDNQVCNAYVGRLLKSISPGPAGN